MLGVHCGSEGDGWALVHAEKVFANFYKHLLGLVVHSVELSGSFNLILFSGQVEVQRKSPSSSTLSKAATTDLDKYCSEASQDRLHCLPQ